MFLSSELAAIAYIMIVTLYDVYVCVWNYEIVLSHFIVYKFVAFQTVIARQMRVFQTILEYIKGLLVQHENSDLRI